MAERRLRRGETPVLAQDPMRSPIRGMVEKLTGLTAAPRAQFSI
jgi:hypothetical protein